VKPLELFEKCMDAIDAFNDGDTFADEPFIYLVVPRLHCPQGRKINLFGTSGPRGIICNVKQTETGFDVVAVFPAVPIIKALGDVVGAKIRVSNRKGSSHAA